MLLLIVLACIFSCSSCLRIDGQLGTTRRTTVRTYNSYMQWYDSNRGHRGPAAQQWAQQWAHRRSTAMGTTGQHNTTTSCWAQRQYGNWHDVNTELGHDGSNTEMGHVGNTARQLGTTEIVHNTLAGRQYGTAMGHDSNGHNNLARRQYGLWDEDTVFLVHRVIRKWGGKYSSRYGNRPRPMASLTPWRLRPRLKLQDNSNTTKCVLTEKPTKRKRYQLVSEGPLAPIPRIKPTPSVPSTAEGPPGPLAIEAPPLVGNFVDCLRRIRFMWRHTMLGEMVFEDLLQILDLFPAVCQNRLPVCDSLDRPGLAFGFPPE